jgi:hypothetical protein
MGGKAKGDFVSGCFLQTGGGMVDLWRLMVDG